MIYINLTKILKSDTIYLFVKGDIRMKEEKIVSKLDTIAKKYCQKEKENLTKEELELWLTYFDAYKKYNYEFFNDYFTKYNFLLTSIVLICELLLLILGVVGSILTLGILKEPIFNWLDKLVSTLEDKFNEICFKNLKKELINNYNNIVDDQNRKEEALKEISEINGKTYEKNNKNNDDFVATISRLLNSVDNNDAFLNESETLNKLGLRYFRMLYELRFDGKKMSEEVQNEFWEELIKIENNISNKLNSNNYSKTSEKLNNNVFMLVRKK